MSEKEKKIREGTPWGRTANWNAIALAHRLAREATLFIDLRGVTRGTDAANIVRL